MHLFVFINFICGHDPESFQMAEVDDGLRNEVVTGGEENKRFEVAGHALGMSFNTQLSASSELLAGQIHADNELSGEASRKLLEAIRQDLDALKAPIAREYAICYENRVMEYVFNAVGSPFKTPYYLRSFAKMQKLIGVAESGESKIIDLTICGPHALEAYRALASEQRASVKARLAAVISNCDLVVVYIRDCKKDSTTQDRAAGLSEEALLEYYDQSNEDVAAGLRGLNKLCASLGI